MARFGNPEEVVEETNLDPQAPPVPVNGEAVPAQGSPKPSQGRFGGIPVGEPKSAEEAQQTKSGAKGYLKDSARDAEAYEDAKRRFEGSKKVSPFGSSTLARFGDNMSFNLSRPISGLVSYATGDGYEYGKAVDRYIDDFESADSGIAGSAAEVAGSLASPGPGKLGFLGTVGTGAVMSAAEQRALSTEGDEYDLSDDASSAVLGGTVSGVVKKVGDFIMPPKKQTTIDAKAMKGKSIGEIAKTARTDLEVSGLRETAADEFKEAIVKDYSRLYDGGREKIITAKQSGAGVVQTDAASSDFIEEVTGKAVDTTFEPSAILTRSLDTLYGTRRNEAGKEAIKISQMGTPSAYRYAERIREFAQTRRKEITIKDIDNLRTEARGLSPTNSTDAAAIADLNQMLDDFLDTGLMLDAFKGDAGMVSMYRKGRREIALAMELGETPGLKKALENNTLPGSVLADEIMTLSSKGGKEKAAQAVQSIRDTVGEESDSMARLRAGFLVDLLQPDSPEKMHKRISDFVHENPALIQHLFNPDQSQKLMELAVGLENIKDTRYMDPALNSDIFGALIASVTGSSKVGQILAAQTNARRGAAAGVGLGSITGSGAPVGAITGAAAGLALDMLAKTPVRVAVGASMQHGAFAAGRSAADNLDVDVVGPATSAGTSILNLFKSDEELEGEALQRELGGR